MATRRTSVFSAFAGNPLLIHVPGATAPASSHAHAGHLVDFATVIPHKKQRLAQAFERFVPDDRFHYFVQQQRAWLDDYALFMAIKQVHGGVVVDLIGTPGVGIIANPQALAAVPTAAGIERDRAGSVHGAVLHSSCSLGRSSEACRRTRNPSSWATCRSTSRTTPPTCGPTASYFKLKTSVALARAGRRAARLLQRHRAALGQPDLRLGRPAQSPRLSLVDPTACVRRFEMFDLVRTRPLPRLRGVSGRCRVMPRPRLNGRWVKGPGIELFDAIVRALGPLPIVAENLGLITPEVETMREQLPLSRG
jgi:4-alpha-glucanotransferase